MKTRLRAELWDKLHYILSHSTDRMIRIALQYDGLIQPETLKKALDHVTTQHPILHSAFRDHPLRPYWEVQPYSVEDILTVNDILTVTEAGKAEKEAGTEAEQAKQRFMHQIIPTDSNVQYKVALINHKGNSQLCIMINHMCVDGRGSQILLNYIAEAYSKIYKNLPLPEINSGSRAHSKIYTGLTFWNRLVAGVLVKNITQIKEKRTFAYTQDDPSDKPEMITVKWSGEEIAAIRTAAKKNGATVNDLLLSFYAQALYETCDFPKEAPLTITCMVDNRRHIQDTTSTGLTNHVGLMQLRIDGCGSTINHTVTQMTKITAREKKKRFFGLSGIPLIRLGYYLPFFLAKPGTLLWFLNPLLGFSNLGKVPEGLFKMGKSHVVDGLFFGPVQYKPYISLYIHMMCNALYFSVAIRGNDKDRQKILHLFDTMKHHMKVFVNDQTTRDIPLKSIPLKSITTKEA
jgi:NRPS condensation-like uncharacterized protein